MSDKDAAQAELQAIKIKSGDKFTHYKRGGVYVVVTLAVKEDTLEPLVVYKEEGTENVWVRTYENWSEEVADNGIKKARFTRA